MPAYLAPGVYVEEVKSAVQPIAGVSTSTAGFVGVVSDDVVMPAQPGKFQTDPTTQQPVLDADKHPVPEAYPLAATGQPQLITGWVQFKNTFGDIQTGNHTLALAVYGFFNNGGGRCWVTRVAPGADADATQGRLIAALDAFKAIDEISLLAVPGAITDAVQTAVLDHCENAYLYRFAILDSRRTTTFQKSNIQGGVRNSNHGAIYFPWISVFDPVTNTNIIQPPSGHIAGCYARVDTQRGVFKAPANEVVRGALGVEAILSKEDQAGLNPDGVNVIRKFDGNITIWGARTMGGDAMTEYKYINVRRLLLYLEASIDRGTQWVVFEPNDYGLWAKITRNVTAFLTTVWRDGALFGRTAAEAFYVKCDSETNPPEIRDLGQVVTEIGVAVVKPAEFVVFRITQWAGPAK